MSNTLYYIHDPMCSWCYAFGPVWKALQAQLPDAIKVERLLGGLAPDSNTPMEETMRQTIEATWRRIEEKVPGTHFNYDFWQKCTPYRSTYMSCRAVLAATLQGAEFDVTMTQAIQHAYYRQARNPSLPQTLIELASELALDSERFAHDLTSAACEHALTEQRQRCRELGVDAYPSLVLSLGTSRWPIAIDYNDQAPMLETIELLMSM